MGSRLHLIGGLALAMAVACGAQARDFEMGDDNDYPYSIMTPEPGTAGHHRATVPRRVRHGETSQRDLPRARLALRHAAGPQWCAAYRQQPVHARLRDVALLLGINREFSTVSRIVA